MAISQLALAGGRSASYRREMPVLPPVPLPPRRRSTRSGLRRCVGFAVAGRTGWWCSRPEAGGGQSGHYRRAAKWRACDDRSGSSGHSRRQAPREPMVMWQEWSPSGDIRNGLPPRLQVVGALRFRGWGERLAAIGTLVSFLSEETGAVPMPAAFPTGQRTVWPSVGVVADARTPASHTRILW